MQLYKSIKKIQLTIVSILLMGSVQADPIGSIIEQTGSSQILRNEESLVVSPAYLPEIQLMDIAETANGRMLIEFLDKAELSLTEHTRVLIDTVIFDPDPNKSKMTMNMVLGTARFASGRLALVNKANIDIRTPTATIGIRGTDFTTTIDELGRSMIILLPDVNGDASGEIVVSNEAGSVTLNEAYQATVVSSLDSSPATPVTVQNITVNMIDNMFIVNPPTEIRNQLEEDYSDEQNEDQGLLDIDFLEFNELEQDTLEDTKGDLEFSELDIDLLDVDFLTDLLDVIEELDKVVAGSQEVSATSIGSVDIKGAAFGFNKDSQYNIFEEDGDIVLYRVVNGTIRIKLDPGARASIETLVEGYEGIICLNGCDDTIIVIRQN